MGNSVSLSARRQSMSLAPSITTSYTASPAVATLSNSFLDFGFTTKDSRSPASLQISTSLSSKDVPGTDNTSPCSANCYAEEGVRSLERRGAEALEVTGESIQPRSVVPPKKSYHAPDAAPPMNEGADPPDSPPPQPDAQTGVPNSAINAPAAEKPVEQEVGKSTQKNTAAQPVPQAQPVSVPGSLPDKGVISPHQLTPELAVEPESTTDSADPSSAEALEVEAPASEKFAVPQQSPLIPKPDDAPMGKAPPEPAAAPEVQVPAPQEKKPDLEKQASEDQSSLKSPPKAAKAEKEKTKPVDPEAKAPPASRQPVQISLQAHGKAAVKDAAPAQKKLHPGKAQTVPRPPSKEKAKEKPRIIYIPKKPIQLFGRPHAHHAEMK